MTIGMVLFERVSKALRYILRRFNKDLPLQLNEILIVSIIKIIAMLNDIRFGVYGNHPKTRELNHSINVVAIMYLLNTGNLQTNDVKYVVIDIEDFNNFEGETFDFFSSWARLNCKLDFEMFLQSDSKDKIQLELLHATMLKLADKLNWDCSGLNMAYDACIEKNFIHKFPLFKGKNKMSPNRNFKVSFRAEWVSTSFKIFIDVKDKNNIINGEFLLTDWEGWLGIEVYSMKFEWIDNERFCLFTTYKGLRGKEWVVDLTMPIALLSSPF